MTTVDFSTYKALKIERQEAVLRVTIDNPPHNANTPQIHAEMMRLFNDIGDDDPTRVVVITGAGTTFSAGGNIKSMQLALQDRQRWAHSMRGAREFILGILGCDKPIIGRVNGMALGLGATIVACCDITIMDEEAKIGDTHVKMGLAAGDGGSLLWPHLIGLPRARRYLLTGDLLTGRQAAEIGLVTEAVPAAELDATVDAWARRLAQGASQAISATKRALNMTLRQQAQVYMDAQLGLETFTQSSNDHAEAVDAFINKRKPNFTGS